VNQKLFSHYQSLINLRKKHTSLRRGDYQILHAKNGIFAFSRKSKNEQIISIFNTSNFHQVFSSDSLNLDGNPKTVLLLGAHGKLPPHSYSIYEIK
jgi:glycosidase